VTVGYSKIQTDSDTRSPAGISIFGFRQNGVLVTEATVPAARLIQSGRIFAEVNGPVKRMHTPLQTPRILFQPAISRERVHLQTWTGSQKAQRIPVRKIPVAP
jgi:hypothetical protein